MTFHFIFLSLFRCVRDLDRTILQRKMQRPYFPPPADGMGVFISDDGQQKKFVLQNKEITFLEPQKLWFYRSQNKEDQEFLAEKEKEFGGRFIDNEKVYRTLMNLEY